MIVKPLGSFATTDRVVDVAAPTVIEVGERLTVSGFTTPLNVTGIVFTMFGTIVTVVDPVESSTSDESYSEITNVSEPSGAAMSTVHVVAGVTHGALVVMPPTVALMLAVPCETYCGVRLELDGAVPRGTLTITRTSAVLPLAGAAGGTAAAGVLPPPPPQLASTNASAATRRFNSQSPSTGSRRSRRWWN